ncbi:MAG: monofunctional biosynthetic peptidoglycan transglycosylase [Alphaproteobacteria bacterium]|nr:monofunctional biosynthetic peptidoglycan transglycosylase [Alphaproteobacteria bacterium]
MGFLRLMLLGIASLWLALLAYNTVFPPISTLMAARAVRFERIERRYVPLRRISPYLVRAVIAAEDGRFCDHHGVDWSALQAVVSEVVEEDDASHGASTISMQTAKNLFLWHGFSYVRKPVEIPLALLLDAVWGKRRVMEAYLNVAEFGRGVFGVEAASRHYFGKSAARLSMREAALLAAVLPSPRRRNPAHPSAFVSLYAQSIALRAGGVASACVRRYGA